MANLENVEGLGKLIGRPVVSVETANKLGHINDLIVEPLTGRLAGFCVARFDETSALVSVIDVHGIGPDAIMVERDESLVLAAASPLAELPRAKTNLIGVKIITEHGQLLGKISDLHLCLLKDPVLIYEVRASIFDKLLGHALYVSASLGSALAADRSALVINGAPDKLENQLEAVANRVFGPFQTKSFQPSALQVEVRSRAD